MPFIPLQSSSESSSPLQSQGFTPLAGEKLTPVNAKAPPQSSLLDDYIEHVKGGATASADFLGAIPGSIASGLSVPYSAVKSLATGSDMADEVAKNAEASMKAFQPSEYIKLSPEAERGRQAAQETFNKPAELGAQGLKGAAMLPYIAADKLGITEHGADFAQQMLHGDTPEMAPGFNALTETAGMVPGYGVFGLGGKGGTLEKTMGKDLEAPKDLSKTGTEPTIEDHGKYQVIKDSTGRVTKVVDKETGKVTDYTEPMSQGPLDVDAVIGGHPAEPPIGKEPVINEPREPQIGETRSPEELAQEAAQQAEIDFKRSQNINYDVKSIGYDRLNKRRKATPNAPDLTLETPEEAQARVDEHKQTGRDISQDIDILKMETPQAAGGRVARQRISELKEKLGQYGQYTGEILDRIQGDKPLENQIGKVKTQVDKINSLLEDRLIQLSDSTFVRNGEIARTKEVQAKYGKWTREITTEKDKLNEMGSQLYSDLNDKYGDFVNGPLPQTISKSQTYRGKQGGAIDLQAIKEGLGELGRRLKTGWDAMMERREPRMGEPLQEGGLEMLKRGYDAAKEPYEPRVYRPGDQAGYRMNKGPGGSQRGAVMNPWERKDPVYQETKQKLTEEQMAKEHEEFARLAQSRNTKQPELAPMPSSPSTPMGKVITSMKVETLVDDLKAKLDEYKKGPNWKALGEFLLGPMSGSPAEAAGHIKTFANKVAFAQLARARMIGIMNKLKKSELKDIYEARQADELGEKQGYKAKNGQDTLPQKSKKIASIAQEDYRDAWQEAQETGTMVGGYENYTPRRVIALLSDGTVKSLAELTRKESIGGVYGPKRTSSSLIGRKYLTAEETEAAAKESFGDNVQLIRDIRVLPLVTAELRKVSATKVLLERIRKYGNDNFIETVSTEPQRGWQTVNHPAFRNVWVHPDYSPAIEAILNQKPSNIVARILMTTKAKSTGLLLLNPGIHNTLIFSRAIPMAPLNVLTGQAYMKGAALRGSPLPNWMFEAYNIPRRVFNFPEIERKSQEEGWAYQKDAMLHNFRPPSRAAKFEDSDTYTDPKIGNSWTAQLTGQAARVFNKQVEAMQTVDKIGEFWHESMLWNRVADLGMYIYDKAWRDMVKTGMTEDNAKYAAGGLANRYMSTMPIESMSKGLRTFLNIILLSRQLNVSNLGIYKDFIAGLPNEVRGQINDAHQVQLGNKYLQSKQMKSLLVDMVVMYWGVNAALQSGIAAYKKNGEFFDNLGKEGKAYAERFTDFIQREGENPLVFLDDSVGVSPLTRNEDNKKDRIYLGNDTNDQGMYLKNLFGGTGERLTKIFTHPADLGKQLQSQHMKFLLGNDFKGGVFSKDVWGPDDKALTGIEKIGAVAKTFADSYLSPNSQTLDSISEASKDNPNQINKLKLIGALAPVSFSKGRPGGPQQAVLNAEKAREDFRFIRNKKAIDNSLDRDDTEAAYDKLIESGKDTKEAISYIKQHYGLEKKSSEQQVKMYKKGNEDTIQQFEQVNNY